MSRNIEFHHGRKKNDGKKPRLLLKNYLTATPMSYPATTDWLSDVVNWPMYLNDRYGDCTCAAAGHMIQAWSTYGQGSTATISNMDVLAAYEAVSGFDPNDPSTDNGAVMQEVLGHWRKNGIGGHKILAFAEVDVTNIAEVKAACYIFGTVYIGIDFPDSAMDQFNNEEPWEVVSGARVEGGHAINVGFYDTNTYKLVTWGAVQEMSQAFWDKYVEEAWVVIGPEWLNEGGLSPTGLNLHALGDGLHSLTGDPNPFPEEPPVIPSDVTVSPDETLATFLRGWFKRHGGLPRHPILEAALITWLSQQEDV